MNQSLLQIQYSEKRCGQREERVQQFWQMGIYHQKTIIFGALAHDGRQLFRQYDRFDQYCFLDYPKELRKKFGKILAYADRAPQRKSRLMQKYLDGNHDVVLDWFPKGSLQFNAVEEVV